MEYEPLDVLIITALQEEQDAVKNAFGCDWQLDVREHMVFNHFQFETHGRKLTVAAVNQTDMGMVHAAVTTSMAVRVFHPKLIAMTGICAGVEGKVNLGDIVIARQVFDYGSGKFISGKIIPHPTPVTPDNWLFQLLESCSAQADITESIKQGFSGDVPDWPLTIHHASIGSGAAVISDDQFVQSITQIDRKLYAIDMEAYGVALAAALAATQRAYFPCFILKGVVDFAGIHKNDAYHGYGAFVSALYLRKFLEFPLSAEIF